MSAAGPDDEIAVPGAACAVWWTGVPPVDGRRAGWIGRLRAGSADALEAALRAAGDRLAREGCAVAAGPIDGSTWREYRLVTDRGTEPPFAREPDHPADWVGAFRAAGFAPAQTYCSAVVEPPPADPEAVREADARGTAAGVTVRAIDPGRLEADLRAIHRVCLAGFAGQPYYAPLDEAGFLALYRGVLQSTTPDLFELAERDGDVLGFLYAYPDRLAEAAGRPATVVLKTLAVAPGAAGHGLGGRLVARFHARAAGLGFARVIHALMHDDNRSVRMSAKTARIIRRYAVFERRLDA